jgi:hypothetical protein
MEAMSPIFAALGVSEFDALNELAGWLDGRVEPMATSETSGWYGLAGEEPARAAGWEI